MSTTFRVPTQEDLEAQALNYIKGCCEKEYRQMKKSGELKEHCQRKANAARRYAETLVQNNGESPERAWSLAVRNIILERESD